MRTFHKEWTAALAAADPTDRTEGAIRKAVCEKCLNVTYAVGVFDRLQRDVDRCAFCGGLRLFGLRGLTDPELVKEVITRRHRGTDPTTLRCRTCDGALVATTGVYTERRYICPECDGATPAGALVACREEAK